MDHLFIEEHDIAGRYWAGKLSSDDEERFELHLLDCKECVARVQEFEGLRAGLAEARRVRAMPAAGWRIAAIAAGIIFLLTAGTAYFFRQELVESRRELALAQQRPPIPAPPNHALARASLYRLEIVRGEASPNRVLLPATPEPIVFSLRLDLVTGSRYRASLLEKSGNLVAQQGDLAMDQENTLVLTFSSAVLRPGDYILRVEAAPLSGQYSEIVSYPVQALPKP